MKQLIQNYSTGELTTKDVPAPIVTNNTVVVRNVTSLVSIGTERSIIELGKQSLLGKARQRPDLVKRFIEKARTDGLMKTFQEAMGRLDSPTALGYSSAGVVVEVGTAVTDLSPGDRVACIGAGFASHAEYVRVPSMLCTTLPERVGFDEAAFGMLGIIAMQGFRTARVTSGETVAVIGLGLLGLLTVQILSAYGFVVIGYDPDPSKIAMAQNLGLVEAYSDDTLFRSAVERTTDGRGVDAVIVTAATKDSSPVHLSVDIVRFSGRVVIVGVADIHPSRNEMWHKEVEIIVSKAGGPGSLDPLYENKGIDYPAQYARWTQRRNLDEFLRLVGAGRINLRPMISHRVPFDEVVGTYESILSGTGGPYIGVVVEYDNDEADDLTSGRSVQLRSVPTPRRSDTVVIGAIGAGLFANALLLPALVKTRNAYLHTLSTTTGARAEHSGRKFGFAAVTTDYRSVLTNSDIQACVIATPHNIHAGMVAEALQAGKHVFVEKPLCISPEELSQVDEALAQSDRFLMVGYNRRFSSHAGRCRDAIASSSDPVVLNYRVNAGFVPADHWVHSAEQGRSRIVGEMGHFLDMMQFLTGSLVERVYAERVAGNGTTSIPNDNIVATIRMQNGSVANFLYSAGGNRGYPREMIEVHAGATTAVLEDYRKTTVYTSKGKSLHRTRGQEMGYQAELSHFVDLCRCAVEPRFSYDEIRNSTMATFKIEESLSSGTPITL